MKKRGKKLATLFKERSIKKKHAKWSRIADNFAPQFTFDSQNFSLHCCRHDLQLIEI